MFRFVAIGLDLHPLCVKQLDFDTHLSIGWRFSPPSVTRKL
jgi:hypothetical protein